MQLTNKKILIISPQFWGKMFISKHHYAIELAARGNEVYFLNPPNANLSDEFLVDEVDIDNLYIIHHKLNFSYKLKFKSAWLFHWNMKRHINKLKKYIDIKFDIIWSFDLGNLYPFYLFSKEAVKIFHPVDEPLNKTAVNSAKGSQIIFSTTNEILAKYHKYSVPKFQINHGLKDIFLSVKPTINNSDKLKIGFSGNLLRRDIDRETLLEIIKQYPQFEFNCWGSYNIEQSNISGSSDSSTKQFIKNLRSLPNVTLHGVKITEELAVAYQQIDVFLICYKVINDKSIGENYHKTLEFLSTGKPIVSHNFSSYRNKLQLVQMDATATDNKNLHLLFKEVVNNLSKYNTTELINARKKFAADNIYQRQIDRIECLINLCEIYE